MAKKGPLSKVEKFFIVQNKDDKSVKELADDLGRSEASVEKVLAELPPEEEIKKDTGVVTEVRNSKTRELMGRKTAGGRKGVSVMTPAASEYADATRENRIKKGPTDRPERFSDAGIAKIYPDEE